MARLDAVRGAVGPAYQEKDRVVIVSGRHGKQHILTVVVDKSGKPAS